MPSSTIGSGRLAGACLAILLTLQPALASDGLDRLAGVLADTPSPASQPTAFDFVDPRLVAVPQEGISGSIALNRLLSGFVRPDEARALTGVDFKALTGVLVIGDATTQVIAVTGPDGFAGALPAALSARDFQRHVRPTGEAFAFGADDTIDPRRTPDPFRLQPWAAQRLALSGRVLVWAVNWAGFDAAAGNLAQPARPRIAAFRSLNQVAATAGGGRGDLMAGFGLDVERFALPARPLPDATSALSGALELRPPLRMVMPPWSYALVGVVGRGEQERIVVALHYEGPPADAKQGLATAATRLAAWKPEMTVPIEGLPLSAVEQRIVPAGGATVGLWSAVVNDGAPGAALKLLARWRQSVWLSDFAPLNLTE
ncbi:MAG: hypothetical protein J0H01_16035 [Rhizobiales bacterium]|nr:hypothetical protein [Hyphomicrobiales bacterium]